MLMFVKLSKIKRATIKLRCCNSHRLGCAHIVLSREVGCTFLSRWPCRV